MVNKVVLIGRLGKDPEVRHLDGDRRVANLTLATNERYTRKDGQKVETTEWHDLEMWDGLARVAEQYLKKGNLIYVEGKIKTDNYEKNGETRYRTRIRVNSMNMLDSNRDSGSAPAPAQPAATNKEQVKHNETAINEVLDKGDDLPF